MKILVFVSLCAAVSGFFTDVDDKIDISHLVNDPEEIKAHLDCYLDKKPCTDQMKGYKKHIVESINNNCRDCSPLQKHNLEQVFKIVVTKYPDDLMELRKKYRVDAKHYTDISNDLAKY